MNGLDPRNTAAARRFRFLMALGLSAGDLRDAELKEAGDKLETRLREARAAMPPRPKAKGHAADCTCFRCSHA